MRVLWNVVANVGEWMHEPALGHRTVRESAAMKQSLVHSGLDAIARMSTTRTNYWTELVLYAFSFIEYFFHRWLFHTHIPLFEQGHRMHHERPLGYDSLPFFLPPIVLLSLTGLLVWLMPLGFALLLAGAITFGYITYGLSHFIIHHVRFRQPLLRRWAGAHHVHHYHPETNFGVTTLLWDILLGTRYVRQPRKL